MPIKWVIKEITENAFKIDIPIKWYKYAVFNISDWFTS